MKKFYLVIFLILSFNLLGQKSISELEIEKSILNTRKSNLELLKSKNSIEKDSITEIFDRNIYELKYELDKLLELKDSLYYVILSYSISEDNLKTYYFLKDEKIIDPSSKKYSSFYKKLKKDYFLSNEQKYLILQGFICLGEFNGIGRIYSVEKIQLSIHQTEKQQKLLAKKDLLFLSSSDLILENLTGVNLKYLLLKNQYEDLNQTLDSLNLLMKKSENLKENLEKEFVQKKIKCDAEDEIILKSIFVIENQISFIKQQKEIQVKSIANFSKFNTKKVNGIEICTTPLFLTEFRNGDDIKKARTEGEWEKFIELKIPAYHLKDYDDNQGSYGFIYNFYALTDNRELAPYGFHKLNLLDFNYLEKQTVFTETKLVDCYHCVDGTEGIYESCKNCNYWTETQKKYNICSKCQNNGYFIRGSKKCSTCNGTKKSKELTMKGREFCVLPSYSNSVECNVHSELFGWGEDNLLAEFKISTEGTCDFLVYTTDTKRDFNSPVEYYFNQGYQILICRDRNINYSDDFISKQIGDIEIMNIYLNVTTFRNGDVIRFIEDPVEWELAIKNKIPAYCYFNNVNDGKGCIYNIHAWNDKRGLMPVHWRSITKNDLANIYLNIKQDIKLTSSMLPVSAPKGIRRNNGVFENNEIEYNEHVYQLNFEYDRNYLLKPNDVNLFSQDTKSGYVLCVRDFNKSSFHLLTTSSSLSVKSKQLDGYFGDGGSPFEGSGGGTDGGVGPSRGGGNGAGKGRVRINNVCTPQYNIDVDCRVGLKLTINSDGIVTDCRTIKSVTTCTNQTIINDVIRLVKQQVRFNKDPGAPPEMADYTIRLNAM